jgi:hypothetical protein
MADVTLFGIRHHGPGCARSLVGALDALAPDCVLIEGPAGCEDLVAHLADEGLVPPVALLSHCPDDPQLAVFHPYAVFSPEWQAMRWARAAGVPVRFIDVPAGTNLAWQRADRAPSGAAPAVVVEEDPANEEAPQTVASDAVDVAPDAEAVPTEPVPADPLDWLAHAAGYGDGEGWWNHMVEERGDGEGLFDAIAQAMTEVREHASQRTRRDDPREAIREAHMRSALRDARKDGHTRIAVVCGAWHVPALAADVSASADRATLKNMDKVKSQSTWVPWTYPHLAMRSGYGAGIASPGWYEYLWRNGDRDSRAVGWFARVARLMREHELDCSSAHLIEAARLADALAALRERPAPGLAELNEATQTVICNGDDAPMRLIAERLLIGDALGSVPSTVPTVPLQRDVEAQQKRLRLKPEALHKRIDLDLRNENDLARSRLLHRLNLIDIRWGTIAQAGRSARGTFHELWDLAWEPGYEVDLIVASRYGHTLELAAVASAAEKAGKARALSDLAELVDVVLLADLPRAVAAVAHELEMRAATDADPLALLGALPALANVHRYGNVRNTDAALVGHLFDGMLARACVGVPLAVRELDGEPAQTARTTLLAADRAIALRDGEEQTTAWRRALRMIALADGATPLVRGACTRLLLDAAAFDTDEVARQLALNLSTGAEPLAAAQWLDGFLNRNAAVLLHGDTVWPLIDAWVSQLGDEHFLKVVPLLRRTFSEFEAADRRDLGERVKRPAGAKASTAATPDWNEARALRALPMLRELFGVTDDV